MCMVVCEPACVGVCCQRLFAPSMYLFSSSTTRHLERTATATCRHISRPNSCCWLWHYAFLIYCYQAPSALSTHTCMRAMYACTKGTQGMWCNTFSTNWHVHILADYFADVMGTLQGSPTHMYLKTTRTCTHMHAHHA